MHNHWLDEWESEQEKQDDGKMSKSDAELKALQLMKKKSPELFQVEFKELNNVR